MWHRTNGHMVQRGLGWIIATLLGTVLASCGAMADDNQARPEGDALSSESVSEEEMGAPEIAEDGRMLQPRGHEGLWFETEPADPWERYVWLSQKYVGDPVHLGQLAEGEVPEGFVGEPDICSEEVIARMGEIGLKKIQTDSEFGSYTCQFEAHPIEQESFSAYVDLDMFHPEPGWSSKPTQLNFGPDSGRIVREFSQDLDDYGCAGIGRVEGSRTTVLTYSDMGYRSEGFEDACRRAYLTFWILKNVGILGRSNDQI